jgi:hypothetical protein
MSEVIDQWKNWRKALADMTALKDKAADIAIAIGFEHNMKVKELEKERAVNKVLVEVVELLGDHMSHCECYCMDIKGIASDALAKAEELRK